MLCIEGLARYGPWSNELTDNPLREIVGQGFSGDEEAMKEHRRADVDEEGHVGIG